MRFNQCFLILFCLILALPHSVKAANTYTEKIKSLYRPVTDDHVSDPLTKKEDKKENKEKDPPEQLDDERVDGQKKEEWKKNQVNYADSSYSSLIKYNFVFYFIYKHKYESRSQRRLDGFSLD